mmetsp:Transcript_23021/g.37084  ORF Transcript_23021/g.37084 Transcript_23021/m.37084 type:complete len:416 (+) Transcript_23021:3-1250(+)
MSLAFVQKSDGIGTYSIAWVVTTLLITSLAGVNLVLWRSRRRYDLAPNITEEKFGDLQLTQDLTFNSDVLQSSCALEAKEVKDVKEPVVNFNPTEYTRLEGMKDNEINATMKSFVTRLGYVAKATILLMLFLLLFGLIFSTSAAQVASDASTQINQTYKQLLTFALAAAHVILSLILPIFVDSIISLYSLWFRGGWAPEESSTFALILNTMLSTTLNILAPIGCESFISPSCLKPLIKTAKSYPSSPIETGVCSSFLIHAVTGEILGCDEYLVLETGSYTPPFHFRADYCTSQLVRVFAPFFISMVLQMLIAPFFSEFSPLYLGRPFITVWFAVRRFSLRNMAHFDSQTQTKGTRPSCEQHRSFWLCRTATSSWCDADHGNSCATGSSCSGFCVDCVSISLREHAVDHSQLYRWE